jgi:hypothetical protein
MQKALIVFAFALTLCSARVSQDCVTALEDLPPYGQELVRDYESRDWERLLEDAVEAGVGISRAVEKCLGQEITLGDLSSPSCTDALVALLPSIEAIYEAVSRGDYASALNQIIQDLPAIEAAAAACEPAFLPEQFLENSIAQLQLSLN